MFKEERVFSHVGCSSLSGFDEISDAMIEAGISLTEKAEQERKRLQNVYAPMLHVLNCITKRQGQAVSGSRKRRYIYIYIERERDRKRERERERVRTRVCCLCNSKCVCVYVCVCVCVCVCERERELSLKVKM